MNSVNLIGRITKDIELNYLPNSGAAVANFDIALNEYVNKKKETYFFTIIAWGKQAENAAQYLGKGKEVGVTGRLKNRKYVNKKGDTVTVTEIVANDLKYIGNNETANPGPPQGLDGGFTDITPVSDTDAPW